MNPTHFQSASGRRPGFNSASADSIRDLPPTVGLPPSTPAITPPPPRELKYLNAPEAEPEPTGTMPRPGERFLGFRLVEELGRGAFARVFLAEQESLAGRKVALKVTLRPTREAERLARLQHTNVVPVYSVHESPPVQVICMPFLGRRTLADLLRAGRPSGWLPGTHGRRTSATRKVGSTTLAPGSASSGFRGLPSGDSGMVKVPAAPLTDSILDDAPTVLRLLAHLADGLAHAHDRGILHLDLKPANILLADSGEPMLLDFNLSLDTNRADRDMVGGTVTYMAPEQLVDLRTSGKGGVDARTDVYGLGVVAFELLAGTPPFAISAENLRDFDILLAARKAGPPSLCERNPAATPAVEAIVRKMLASDPADRYQTAADLKADLERHLADRPLAFAREPLGTERVRKWRRRNPRLLGRLLTTLAVAAAVTLGFVADGEVRAAGRVEAKRKAEETVVKLNTIRLDLTAADDLTHRPRGIDAAEKALQGYGLPDDKDWRTRVAFTRLPAADQPRLAADLGELMLLLAHAKWQDAKAGPEDDRKQAAGEVLRLVRAARTCFDPGDVPGFLIRLNAELAREVGEKPEAEEVPEPTTARELYLDAVALAATGRYTAAIPLLDKAIAEQPAHAAAQFLLAFCRQQLGQFQRALERYDVARVLLATDPRPFAQRGVIFHQQGQFTAAEAEFSRAIELDPEYGEHYRNRGYSRLRLGKEKYGHAESDFTAALERGVGPLRVLPVRAQVRDGLNKKAEAAADRAAAKQLVPERERDYVARGIGRMHSDPKGALDDFRAAAKLKPDSWAAYQSQMHVLSKYLNDPRGALEVANVAVERFPESAAAHASRALYFARLGQRDDAGKEAEQTRKLSDEASVTYLLACVYSLNSAAHPADATKALALLRKAYRDGFRELTTITDDHDLDPLRKLPEFAEVLKAMSELSK